MFYFGPQGAGGVEENVKRWESQFETEGRKAKIFSGESEQGKYTLLDLTGTYNKPIGPPVQKKSKRLTGWRVVNVLLETKSGRYYLKVDGPEKTIAAIENDIRAAFGGKKETEKEQKAE